MPEWVDHKKSYHSIQSLSKAGIIGELSRHFSQRILTSKIIGSHYGIDYQFPLTHPALMEYVYHLPSSLKYRHGTSRYLIRQVMKNQLPKKVLARKDKNGATAPAALFALQHQLPAMFLANHLSYQQTIIADYVDIPMLVKHIEAQQRVIYDSTILRLLLCLVMFHLV